MKGLLRFAFLSLGLLAGCGGSGGGSPAPDPPPALPPVVLSGVTGTTPADAALGQPLAVQWELPAGISIRSVALEATVVAGPVGNQSQCTVSAGSLATGATSASITIPNTCESKTVKDVQLRVSVESSDGRRTTDTHAFVSPGAPEAFRPLRANLPRLTINTDNNAPITSKEVYIPAQMILDPGSAGPAPVTSGLQIRGRGNSTWGMPKKPYRIRLTSGLPLLGMPSSRDWVLLANYSDKTLLRNALALELGTRIGMPWTPRSAFVEVYLNNRYDGVYQLTENIKVDEDRVNIDEMDEDDVAPDTITGGYLLEVDFRQDGHTLFTALDQLPVVFQDPEEPVQAQEDYVQDYLDTFETVLYSAGFADPVTGYAAHIDVDSFARWFIVNELFRNRDANMWSSCWMYKPRGGRLHMGPLWDFDIAAGNIDYDGGFETTGWWVRDAPWFSRLFEDPVFTARVRQLWNEVRANHLPALFESLSTRAALLQQSQLNNFQRWPILETYVWPNYRIPGSYAGEIDYLQTWLTARMNWLDAQFNP
jgi:hypothetical protein